MSARNYTLSAREKNLNKLIDSLPQINQQKFGYRSGIELPALSANASHFINRNISSSYKVPQYLPDNLERSGTPFSDFFSESETGTPDFVSEESDSSAGSALNRNTAEATKALAAEWNRIERTLYDEDGEKSNRPQIIEECKQWKKLHPQLRIIGKAVSLPEKKYMYRQSEHEEVIAKHYSDYEQFSESEERLSQSSTDVTPQNSPRVFFTEEINEPKLPREKIFFQHDDELGFSNDFCSLLHITPIHIRSPPHRNRNNPSILRSDISSSKWMRNCRPDSSVHFDRNSAKSFLSLDTRNTKFITGSDNKIINGRVMTARQREMSKLEPLHTPPHGETTRFFNGQQSNYSLRKVSLPPLLIDEERKKVSVNSAKKIIKLRKSTTKIYSDKKKHN